MMKIEVGKNSSKMCIRDRVYADHYQQIDGVQKTAPVIDYQLGSLRDDFNFGSVLLFNANAFKEVIERCV